MLMPFDFLRGEGENDDSSDNSVGDDFVELDAEVENRDEKVVIRAETLQELDDIEEVQEHLRNDHIVWVNIGPLKNRDMADLKRAIKRLKKTIRAIDGDMAGVDESYILTCPEYAEIARSTKEE
ncbi:DUF552 domain-containing protein [Nanohaloarchaea archaeon]|jgi:SepF-like predicted cell division protein (DUF552 family)|nr:DUF552 domain-containing protein [Nanohaloarchaea archaeon H01]NMJ77024.1 DUF552 domain-containing protein [Candidatus Nanohaloarchaea archaeon]